MIDEKDKKILLNLLMDGRSSYSEIGRNVGMTRQSVYSRIKSLKRKGIIEKFTVELNKKELGLKLKAFVFIVATPVKELRKEAEKRLKNLPEISQINYLYGQFDIMLEILVESIDELTELLRKLQEITMIKKTETFIVYETAKYSPEDPLKRVLHE